MTNNTNHIPIVDFSAWSLEKADANISSKEKNLLVEKIYEAFSTIGFVYLKRHGISEEQIQKVHEHTKTFFELPTEIKSKYARHDINSNHGWNRLGNEALNPLRPGDYKESFNVTPSQAKTCPDEEVPGFQNDAISLLDASKKLCDRVLRLMAIGLGYEEYIFVKEHMSPHNLSTLRCLYYPQIPDDVVLKEGQTRCGEHSDYGSITLLFQDGDGLEVKTRDGKYVPATPIPGAVVVNIADLMQRWTADKLISTKHRVIIPESDVRRRTVRQSIAYFYQPDNDSVIKCIDGSNKYEPITTLDYLKLRFSVTY